MLQLYINAESGELVGTDEWTPKREDWSPAQRLPRSPQQFECLGCHRVIASFPGPELSCPCGHVYLRCLE